jgi:hypothetical protein
MSGCRGFVFVERKEKDRTRKNLEKKLKIYA